jgi:Bacterial mobilisation protein (MobC)
MYIHSCLGKDRTKVFPLHPFPSEPRACVLPPIRCSVAERDAIRVKAKAANLTQSAYLRQMALSGQIIVRPSLHSHAFIEQLRRIGVNLNQMAQQMHIYGTVSDELNQTLHRLNTLMDEAIATRLQEK